MATISLKKGKTPKISSIKLQTNKLEATKGPKSPVAEALFWEVTFVKMYQPSSVAFVMIIMER